MFTLYSLTKTFLRRGFISSGGKGLIPSQTPSHFVRQTATAHLWVHPTGENPVCAYVPSRHTGWPIWTFCVKAFESYRIANILTDRHTQATPAPLLPRCIADGNKDVHMIDHGHSTACVEVLSSTCPPPLGWLALSHICALTSLCRKLS